MAGAEMKIFNFKEMTWREPRYAHLMVEIDSANACFVGAFASWLLELN